MVAPNYILPDFLSQCPYQLRINPLTEAVTRNTEKWVLDIVHYDGKKRDNFLKTRGGVLSGYCYPDADAFHLQAISDFTEWLFCLDDHSDEYTEEEARVLGASVIQCFRNPCTFEDNAPVCQLAKDFACRLQQSASPRCIRRFVDAIDSYVNGVVKQAGNRDEDSTPDLESYVSLRRETSALRPSFVLIEFAAGIDLPDEVVDHPLIRSMEMAVNDWTSWTNDIVSYNKEQAIGDMHNIVTVIMIGREVGLQTAIDLAGDLCLYCITIFERDRQVLPSWGPEIDRQVQLYVQGLQDWIVGSLHWSFASSRYFGTEGEEIKTTRVVHMISRSEQSAEA